MNKKELIQVLMPDFLKRRKIKSLVSEYNDRIRLRNRAYDLTTPTPEIVYTAGEQTGESLDRTIKFLQTNISMMTYDEYETIIDQNKAQRQARAERLALEKALQAFIVTTI
jgi:hypothetical protein